VGSAGLGLGCGVATLEIEVVGGGGAVARALPPGPAVRPMSPLPLEPAALGDVHVPVHLAPPPTTAAICQKKMNKRQTSVQGQGDGRKGQALQAMQTLHTRSLTGSLTYPAQGSPSPGALLEGRNPTAPSPFPFKRPPGPGPQPSPLLPLLPRPPPSPSPSLSPAASPRSPAEAAAAAAAAAADAGGKPSGAAPAPECAAGRG